MSNPSKTRQDYNSFATDYNNQYALTPASALENELISLALGDLTGLTVLDLGGGSGIHARKAVSRGAVAVDVVDISPGMLKVGSDIETSLGRRDSDQVIRFFEANAAQPLSHLPLREGGYDVVMANWLLDFAETAEVLDAMLGNVVAHLKSGGLFVGVRAANPYSVNLRTGKYGVTYKGFRPFPGGVKYSVVIHTDPPIEFEAATLDVLRSGSHEVYEKAGLTNVEDITCERASVVRTEPEFWRDCLNDPFLVVTKAVKR